MGITFLGQHNLPIEPIKPTLRNSILVFSLLIFIIFNLTGQTIDRGPYLQSVTTGSIVIKWRTDIPTNSKVWYGNSPSNLNITVSSATATTNHEVLINSLSLNTTYYYAVGNNAGQMVGGDDNHYFTTTPDTTGNQIVRAWVLGDCGTANTSQRDVRDAYYNFIGSNHTDAILLLGDNAYSDGTQSEYQMALFENMYEEKLINSVLWSTFGNHDGHSSVSLTQTGPYYDIFTFPKNAQAGGFPSNTEAYYSFDYGNVHFISLNSDDIDADPQGDMMQWLENDIESTNQEWIVAFFHHPPYTGEGGNESDIKTSSIEMRENALPILEAGGVDLVLTGHTHAYQRSFLINGHYDDSQTWDPNTMGINLGDGRIDSDGPYTKERGENGIGTVYIVAGSSGKLFEDDYNYPAMSQNFEKLGSVAIEADGLQMDVKFIDSDGIVQDYFTILKIVDPPVVNITYPADQEYFPLPETITITAEAFDSNGTITKVEFFVDNSLIGTDLMAPYSANWTIPSEGIFKIKAVATDNEGYYTSSLVHINVGHLEVCSSVNSSSDDAEEKADGAVSLTSGDLELVDDGSNQTIGIRFKNLNIPQCAEITNAFVQFTVDATDNINPCNLNIYAQASDAPTTFTDGDWNISSRPKTNATAVWSPADWINDGEGGPDQQTVDIAPLIQEVVNSPGFTANSSIVIIIDGVGKRSAESFDGEPFSSPELCIQYIPFGPDEDNDGVCDVLDQCPNSPEPGMPCNDGNPATSNDMVNSNCECQGSDVYDCPNIPANFGDPCNDGNPNTSNDVINSNCECQGSIIYDCPNIPANFGDSCNDGNPNTSNDVINSNCECQGSIVYDCPNIPANFGDPCNDGNPNTSNDAINSNCECVGSNVYDCPNIPANFGDPCNDGNPDTSNDAINSNCECQGSIVYDCPNIPANFGDSCNDGNPNTSNDVINSNCECQGSIVYDCPNIPANFGDSCNDGNPNTSNDVINSNCECVGSDVYDCPNIPANFGDSCNDGNPNTSNDVINSNCECQGSIVYDCANISANIGDPCNDGNQETYNDLIDSNCECMGTPFDCPIILANIGDLCDDGNVYTTNDAIDITCQCSGASYIVVSVSDSNDDAEESTTGSVNLTSSDLEMVTDGNNDQIVGMRFVNLNINQGADIDSAYIQFTADDPDNINPCELNIYGEASDNAETFSSENFNISSRAKTNSSTLWWPEPWSVSEESGLAQRSADITPIIQEIVDRAGFDSSSSVGVMIEGIGNRSAISYDGDPEKAPRMYVIYKNPLVSIKDITTSGKNAVVVYPVPATDQLNVLLSCTNTQEVPIQIRDINGRLLLSTTQFARIGDNKFVIDQLTLINGIYFMQLHFDGGVQSVKFIIFN